MDLEKLELIQLIIDIENIDLLESLIKVFEDNSQYNTVNEPSTSYGSKSATALKLSLIQRIIDTRKDSDLFEINSVIFDRDDLQPMNIEELNARIEKSRQDSKNGRLVDSNEVFERIMKWS